ncbi:hypothetical protein [Brumimicrobium mesophilum]|uniref:hypothetical protein n=1 Tax=Brumimicrobium mesophilum TaxID=392717 RepID=UPI000D141F9A|nr:hypothetical protein [Brumimicrobium mesophilum]
MKEYSLTGWKDYWELFDELIEQLDSDNKIEITTEFKEAQRYLNGLTDGWYDFKNAFEKSHKTNRHKLTVQQNEIADFLMKALNESLKNR